MRGFEQNKNLKSPLPIIADDKFAVNQQQYLDNSQLSGELIPIQRILAYVNNQHVLISPATEISSSLNSSSISSANQTGWISPRESQYPIHLRVKFQLSYPVSLIAVAFTDNKLPSRYQVYIEKNSSYKSPIKSKHESKYQADTDLSRVMRGLDIEYIKDPMDDSCQDERIGTYYTNQQMKQQNENQIQYIRMSENPQLTSVRFVIFEPEENQLLNSFKQVGIKAISFYDQTKLHKFQEIYNSPNKPLIRNIKGIQNSNYSVSRNAPFKTYFEENSLQENGSNNLNTKLLLKRNLLASHQYQTPTIQQNQKLYNSMLIDNSDQRTHNNSYINSSSNYFNEKSKSMTVRNTQSTNIRINSLTNQMISSLSDHKYQNLIDQYKNSDISQIYQTGRSQKNQSINVESESNLENNNYNRQSLSKFKEELDDKFKSLIYLCHKMNSQVFYFYDTDSNQKLRNQVKMTQNENDQVIQKANRDKGGALMKKEQDMKQHEENLKILLQDAVKVQNYETASEIQRELQILRFQLLQMKPIIQDIKNRENFNFNSN